MNTKLCAMFFTIAYRCASGVINFCALWVFGD